MTPPAEEIAALVERLEAGSGPSREADRAIARLLGWHRVEPRFARNKHGAWISPEDFIGTYSDGSPKLDSLHGTTMHREVPGFTASLDAAVSIWGTAVPDYVPSNPRKAAAAALRARLIAQQEK